MKHASLHFCNPHRPRTSSRHNIVRTFGHTLRLYFGEVAGYGVCKGRQGLQLHFLLQHFPWRLLSFSLSFWGVHPCWRDESGTLDFGDFLLVMQQLKELTHHDDSKHGRVADSVKPKNVPKIFSRLTMLVVRSRPMFDLRSCGFCGTVTCNVLRDTSPCRDIF
eukprot:5462812-Amphidinium_carterae.1